MLTSPVVDHLIPSFRSETIGLERHHDEDASYWCSKNELPMCLLHFCPPMLALCKYLVMIGCFNRQTSSLLTSLGYKTCEYQGGYVGCRVAFGALRTTWLLLSSQLVWVSGLSSIWSA